MPGIKCHIVAGAPGIMKIADRKQDFLKSTAEEENCRDILWPEQRGIKLCSAFQRQVYIYCKVDF